MRIYGDRLWNVKIPVETPSHASTCNPCFWTMASSLRAMPLGRLAPVSHFSTVDSLVLRYRAVQFPMLESIFGIPGGKNV